MEPRNYRLRFLNGCDSRFLAIQFFAVDLDVASVANTTDMTPIEFTVIGSDQGLARELKTFSTLVVPPASRPDVVIDFGPHDGKRIILKNIGGDEPFGGDIPGPQNFEFTNMVMAFDVTLSKNPLYPDDFGTVSVTEEKEIVESSVDRVRKLGLFEGHDPQGRLQPLLGTVEPATDVNGDPILWPDTESHVAAGLVGQMSGTMTWHSPTTEQVRLGDVEEWEIWNLSADAHPIHVHLVKFMLVSRREIVFDSNAIDGEIELDEASPVGDGTFTADRPQVQADGSIAEGYEVFNLMSGETVSDPTLSEYYADEGYPLDVIVALPGQITTIRAKFDKPGRYNWHCHILAHEGTWMRLMPCNHSPTISHTLDHEMMRVYYVYDDASDGVNGGGSALVIAMAVSAFLLLW